MACLQQSRVSAFLFCASSRIVVNSERPNKYFFTPSIPMKESLSIGILNSRFRTQEAQRCSAKATDQALGISKTEVEAMKLPSIGFLGLGIMGLPMAQNLVKAGYNVSVWNRTAAKCQPLIDAGAAQKETPQSVAESCDITFAMLADPVAALDVACGENGATLGLTTGKGYVDVSTVDAQTSKCISEAVKATGATFLEAPVSGSKKPAEDGALIFLAAGDKELFERVEGALDAMGKAKFYLGEVGNGAAMKLVVNMVMGTMMASFSEGLALGEKAGLEPETILQVIGQGAVASPMFALKGPSMINGSFPPAFPLKHQQKDMRLALELGEGVNQPLPVAAAANSAFGKAIELNLGDKDFSAVYHSVKSEEK